MIAPQITVHDLDVSFEEQLVEINQLKDDLHEERQISGFA